MTDFERKRFYGDAANARAICGAIAGVMLALIPIIGTFILIAGGSVLSSRFAVICGASLAAAAVVAAYGDAVARSAARRPAPRPAPSKAGGFSKIGGTLALTFLALPVVVGSLILIQSGDVVNATFLAVVLGSVVAALLIFLYVQAVAKANSRFAALKRADAGRSEPADDSDAPAISASDAARRGMIGAK